MSDKNTPSFYKKVSKQFPEVMSAAAGLGTTVRTAGPLDEKTSHLVQLAAAAAMHSEGSVCSHTRRALEVGASPKEISHTLLLLITTIGFPQAMAALSWSQEEMEKMEKKSKK